MSNGTTLNGLYAARIHKHNAAEVVEEAESMLSFFRDKMLVLAAMSPTSVLDEEGCAMPWGEFVRMEIDDMWDEIQDNVRTQFLAQHILDFPEDCKDDFEGEQV